MYRELNTREKMISELEIVTQSIRNYLLKYQNTCVTLMWILGSYVEKKILSDMLKRIRKMDLIAVFLNRSEEHGVSP